MIERVTDKTTLLTYEKAVLVYQVLENLKNVIKKQGSHYGPENEWPRSVSPPNDKYK